MSKLYTVTLSTVSIGHTNGTKPFSLLHCRTLRKVDISCVRDVCDYNNYSFLAHPIMHYYYALWGVPRNSVPGSLVNQ